MPRIARVVAVGLPHHITQRGNFQQDVFQDDNDRERYLYWLQEYSEKYGTSILVDSLMLNHIHCIAIPHKEDSLAKTFNATHMRYSHYFNDKLERTGHLWQNRFYSCVMDERHLTAAARYVEQNPVRAGLVKQPWEWKWSSARAHIGEGKCRLNEKDLFNFIVDIPQSSWREFINSKQEEQTIIDIRKHTLTGRPLGGKSFIKKLEKKFGRKFEALPVGKPRKD